MAAVGAWVVPLAVYALSARRDVWFWDTGEMDTVPWILGIAHPTAFPAFVLIGYAFSHVVAVGSVAFRMSLMCACATAATAYFVFMAIDDENGNPWIATACAWIFAFGAIVWTRGTRAEVHALAACAFVAALCFALRWYRGGGRAALYAAAVAWGVGLAVHPLLLLALPALLFLALVRRGSAEPAALARAGALAIACAAIWYAYLPLRSLAVEARGLDPAQAIGVSRGVFWNYDRPSTPRGFAALVSGGDFDAGNVLRTVLAGAAHGAAPALYFEELLHELTPAGVALLVAGIGVAARRDRARAAALVLAALPPVIFALGFPPESDPRRYFVASFAIAAVFLGDAGGALARALPRARAVVALGLTVLAGALALENAWIFAQAGDESARAVIAAVERGTPPNAILVSNWLDAPPLAYAAYVERALGHRVVTVSWVGDLGPHVAAWLRARPVYVVGPTNAGGLRGYRLVSLRGTPIARLLP